MQVSQMGSGQKGRRAVQMGGGGQMGMQGGGGGGMQIQMGGQVAACR